MNARAWAANAMEANSAGGSLVNSEAGGGNVLRWQQPLRAQQLARIACVLAFALHTGYDNPVHINARARAWADDAMEDQRASGGLVNSKSAATSPSSSGTGAGKKMQGQLMW